MGRPWSGPAALPHLSVQASGHGHDVARFTVDGEHVLGGALRGLRHDPVAHHPVGCGGIIRVVGRDCHHVGACNRDRSSWGTCLPSPPLPLTHTPADVCHDQCLPGGWMWCVSFSTRGLDCCQTLGNVSVPPPTPRSPCRTTGVGPSSQAQVCSEVTALTSSGEGATQRQHSLQFRLKTLHTPS